MRKRKALSPVVSTVILVAIAITIAVSLAWWFGGLTNQPVNGNEVAQKTYYLGDVIYSEGTETFYFHGVLNQHLALNIVIGHETWQRACSDMYVDVFNKADIQFYIKGVLFKVVEYDANEGWIILES